MTTFEGRWKRLRSTPATNRLPDTFAVSCGRPDLLGGGWCRGQVCTVIRHGDEWRAMHYKGLYKDGERFRVIHGHRHGQRRRPARLEMLWQPGRDGGMELLPPTAVS